MTIYSGFTHWSLWFSIVMLVYQRVILQSHKTWNSRNGYLLRRLPAIFTIHVWFGELVLLPRESHRGNGKFMEIPHGLDEKISLAPEKWANFHPGKMGSWEDGMILHDWIPAAISWVSGGGPDILTSLQTCFRSEFYSPNHTLSLHEVAAAWHVGWVHYCCFYILSFASPSSTKFWWPVGTPVSLLSSKDALAGLNFQIKHNQGSLHFVPHDTFLVCDFAAATHIFRPFLPAAFLLVQELLIVPFLLVNPSTGKLREVHFGWYNLHLERFGRLKFSLK